MTVMFAIGGLLGSLLAVVVIALAVWLIAPAAWNPMDEPWPGIDDEDAA